MIALNPRYGKDNSRNPRPRPGSFLGSLRTGSWSLVAGEDLPSVRLVRHDGQRPLAIEVIGLSSQDLEILEQSLTDIRNSSPRMAVVIAGQNSGFHLPLVPGVFAVEDGLLRFVPRSPFHPGATYHVLLSLEALHVSDFNIRTVTLKFTIPTAETLPGQPGVRQVYPTAGELPENLWKFSLYFETPMQRGHAARFLELRDEAGHVIADAFADLEDEHWDQDGHRLAVRLKPASTASDGDSIGGRRRVLEEGNTYRLRIKPGWRDLNGQPLQVGYEKEFVVSAPLLDRVPVSGWRIVQPTHGSREPLIIEFPRSMDHALLQSRLSLFDPRGRYLDGRVVIGAEERVWEFHPSREWLAGEYSLLVDTDLQDVAGNRVTQPVIVETTGFATTDYRGRFQLNVFLARPRSEAG